MPDKPPIGKRQIVITDEMIADRCLTRQKLEHLLAVSFYPDEPLKIEICLGRTEYVISPI